jgi:DDB1- and CUL4-associated factor 13
MKVKVLSRNPEDFTRETKKDIFKIQRNYDPSVHPLEVPREYTRALNATKLERVFAKPFVGNLEGHKDSVQCITKHSTQLDVLLSGSCDGEIKIWKLSTRKCLKTHLAHDGFVRGICMNNDASLYISCGSDKIVKHWKYNVDDSSLINSKNSLQPIRTIVGQTFFTSIDHHHKEPIYATCGERIDIWDNIRNEPINSYTNGVDSHNSIAFHPIEYSIIGSLAIDRSITLYDMRQSSILRQVVLEMNSNSICWNPLEAMMFTIANEDHNLYTFDMRHLKKPVQIHMGHTSACMSVDYSPTGKELVSGSYDKTLRIFEIKSGSSRDIYHTKRMQHITSVKWSHDAKYVISASDEMNIRLWKAQAAEKLGLMRPREREQLNYSQLLKDKFQNYPEIKRIKRHRHLPKTILNSQKIKSIQKASIKRKDANRRIHSKPGTVEIVSEKEKHVIEEKE